MARRRRGEQRSLLGFGADPTRDPVVARRDARAQGMCDARVARGRIVGLLGCVREERQRAERLDARANVVGRDEAIARREDRPLDVAAQLLVALLDELPRVVEPRERVVRRDEQRAGAQVLEQRHGRREEQRKVVLDARRQLRLGDHAIDRTARRVDRETLAKALAESLDCRVVERKLARGQDPQRVRLAGGQLRLRVEHPQAVDLVVEEIDPDGLHSAGREHVEHRSAHRELARLRDLLHAQVAVLGQRADHRAVLELVADFELQRARDDEIARRQPVEQRAGLDYERERLAASELVEAQQAVGEQVLRRGDRLVRQRFVARETANRGAAEELDLALDPVSGRGARRDHADRAAVAGRGLGGREAQAAAVQLRPGDVRTRRMRQR